MNVTAAKTLMLLIWLFVGMGSSTALAAEPIRIREDHAVGYRYHVSSRVELEGTLHLPPMEKVPKEKDGKPQTLAISGKSTIEYGERVLAVEKEGDVSRTLRVYSAMDFRRKAGDQTNDSNLRPAIRRMVLMRMKHSEVPFSPDGPLTWSEIDQVRTDVFTPALRGLLPEKETKVGDRWTASVAAVTELTDLEEISEGELECKLAEIVAKDRNRYARIDFSGTIAGVNADGPNKQRLEGYLFFDLNSNHLSYLSLRGTSWLLDKDGKEQGKLEGQYVLTRSLNPNVKELSDDAIKGQTLEPNAENTLLLFDEPALGVRFVYPRRWSIRRADARQIALDEPTGGGLLITLEPLKQVPTANAFIAEIESWLKKNQAKVLKGDTAKKIQNAPEELDRFGFEVELEKEILLLDYYVARQESGGTTIAGRYPIKSAKDLSPEAERIAKSLRLVPPKKK